MDIKTLTFFSNYFNHHQKALCDEWQAFLGEGFTFVETEPVEEFRSKMGWGKEKIPSYVLRTYESAENEKKAQELALSSDLVIMGTAPEKYIEERLKRDRIIFRYSERPLKEGFIKFFIPRLTKKYLHLHVRNRDKRIYILAASAYTASDYKKMFNSYPGKCYKFGYFPKHMTYDPKKLMERKREYAKKTFGDEDIPTILWAGRMLRLKRPDLCVKALHALRKKGYDFRLTMVGEGPRRAGTEALVKKYGMEDITRFYDFKSPDEALSIMADHRIYLMTSNFLEGWGSVIYEALNAGCAAVVSHAPGAAPWLVRHEKTGLLYESGSVKSLERQIEKLLKDKDRIPEYGKNAYEQMAELWNPKTASKNVLTLYSDLTNGKDTSIKEGPCSIAEELGNDWYRDR
ncbi:MAG: glycosyltransferase family 4 protein [Lachnospiraceae bacterium]|nr:glycosyltransferase family 4 protein [Lachnospiraceae bacterium]